MNKLIEVNYVKSKFPLIYNKKYFFTFVLMLGHFFGNPLNSIMVLVSTFILVLHVYKSKFLDLYYIFLLLIPILMFSSEIDSSSNTGYDNFFIYFNNILIIYPLAISSSFLLTFSVLMRTIKLFLFIDNKNYFIFWFITLLFSIIGLYLSVANNIINPSGITTGLRIVLTIGVLFLPLSIESTDKFYQAFDKILFLSFIFLIFNLISSHYIFVIVGFLPLLLHRTKYKLVKLFILIYPIYFLINFNTQTLTLLGIFLFSFVLYLLVIIFKISIYNNKIILIFFSLLPLIIIFAIYNSSDFNIYDVDSFIDLVKFKFINDRKPIWDASINDILSSNFFVKGPGNSIMVYFNFNNSIVNWTMGSHNIFLEIGRQLGLFSLLFYILFISRFIIITGSAIKTDLNLIYFTCFFSIYFFYGLSGQSIIYDRIGCFFWLLAGQFSKLLYHNRLSLIK
jgi:hypothetical protein